LRRFLQKQGFLDMKSFSSQIGTKNAPGELKPFGWTHEAPVLPSDSIADFEHDRARMEHRSFGRRDPAQPLAQKPRHASHIARKVAPVQYESPKVEAPTIRHPHLLLRQK
jgi:hypothetical protein